jgi:hypothetical protein
MEVAGISAAEYVVRAEKYSYEAPRAARMAWAQIEIEPSKEPVAQRSWI